ncbi:dihydrofolate reductase family protein [Mucilaginibacter sp. UR6-11]|uniref:dihydrofolate reductase family protein n=1 Tax=Mucilaginibacter sp. UR6-11 TaxID=1435644 RepID=UPI001E605794|nr:dihydrofolate reductase family protein [Mucilaginibacter sp. UR6-11]MCC8425378.1 dihydrofolate reductase family protein [Mucilaginibacter sp. UR6-11]
MRKLKLQMQLSVDGYVAGPNGEMDWMSWGWGEDIKDYVRVITTPVDTIIMGRKLAEGFIPHWAGLMQNPETADEFTQKMVKTPKVVFSKTLRESGWENTVIATGDIAEEVKKLKAAEGGDIITYGGAGFASALIKAGLVDEYHLFINPAAIGNGIPIFKMLDKKLGFELAKIRAFEVGIVALHYTPA